MKNTCRLLRRLAALLVGLLLAVAGAPATASADVVGDGHPTGAKAWDPGLPSKCPKYLVIGVRGSTQNAPNEDDAPPGQFNMGGTVDRFVAAAKPALDGQDVVYYSLPYRAVDPGIGSQISGAYSSSMNGGVTQLKEVVRNRAVRCPDIRIGLVGYSQGADVVHTAIDQFTTLDRSAIAQVLLIADPNTPGTASYGVYVDPFTGDRWNSTTQSSIKGSQGSSYFLPPDIAARTIDFCADRDAVCAGGLFGSFNGDQKQIHTGYGSANDDRRCCGTVDWTTILGTRFGSGLRGYNGPELPVPPKPRPNSAVGCVPYGDVTEEARRAIQAACSQVAAGTWYTWGGGHGDTPGATYGMVDATDPVRSRHDPQRKGFDCSGFVRWAWAQSAGYDLIGRKDVDGIFTTVPATARFTADQGLAPLQPGDLLEWGTEHVAMYLGDGKIVEARESDTHLMVSDFSSHDIHKYRGAIRISALGTSGNATTWGTQVWSHTDASTTSPRAVQFGGPTKVNIACQKHAESVTAEGITNDAWSYLPDYKAWVTNIYVQGAAWLDGVPDCGGPPTGAYSTWGTGVWTHTDASTTSARAVQLGGPTRINIGCQKHAESVTAEGITNDAWSYLPDYKAWVTNIYVQGAAWLDGVPDCGGAPRPSAGGSSTWGTDVWTHNDPSTTSARAHSFPGPTHVRILCQDRGESVTAEGVTNDAWSFLPDYNSWISNIYIQGPAWLDGIPSCSSHLPGEPPHTA
ncbi:cutinase family protein [Kitasatospora sp. NPDC096128]|uniref:cutinase family protein n=1 Tax=Kitasatospora sp. NPDC096128 TaxID=3155547 RepID=UPI00332F867F